MSSLMHHGVKGQRWGVRRFQNKDGTRTAAGKARDDRRVLKKGSMVYRVHAAPKDYVYDNKKYVSTSIEDHNKWADYFGNEYAIRWKPVYYQRYKTKKDLYVATGKDIVDVISTKLDKQMVKRDLDSLEKEVKLRGYDWDNTSKEDHYSMLLGAQKESGKQIVHELQKMGFGAIEDDHGKNVAEDPVIVLDPDKKLRRYGKTAKDTRYLDSYRKAFNEFFAKHTSIGGTMYIEGNALILGDSSYLEHHGILGQKWGVRRFQNKDGTRTAAGKARDQKKAAKTVKNARLFRASANAFQGTKFGAGANKRAIKEEKAYGDMAFEILNNGKHKAEYDDLSRDIDAVASFEYEEYSKKRDAMIEINARISLEMGGIKNPNDEQVAEEWTYWADFDEDWGADLKGNSYDRYLISKGYNPNEIHKRYKDDYAKLRDLASKDAEEYLGPYGDTKITYKDKYTKETVKTTAKEELANKIVDEATMWMDDYGAAKRADLVYTDKELSEMRAEDAKYSPLKHSAFFIEDGTLYLSHHGIRGQRWGVRRFQNRDGSLTNAGRKRLGYATKGAAQTVGKAFKAGVKAGGKAVKAVKAHHEAAEAKKKEKKKEKASKTRLGVMANKDLFTNEEIRKLNERFKLEDEMKMATLQKGVEIAKAVGTIAQNVGTVAKTYEDVTGQSLSPIKRKAAEEKARQDKEDRERRLAREDADEARKAAKEERDIAIHEQTLRKAIASADTQEFTANKTKAEADSSILDLYKKASGMGGATVDLDGMTPKGGQGQSWVEKATAGGKNVFEQMKYDNDPEYKAAKDAHDEKVARKERMEYLDRREKEREAEKAAKDQSLRDMINQSNARTGRGQSTPPGQDSDALFSQKGSLPIDKDRYRNNRAMEKAKQVKEDAAEERAKKQDEKAAKATIDDMMEARRKFTDSARANSNGAFDRETAANYIKGKAKELPSKLNPINAISKKITDKALKEEEAASRKAMEDEYKKTSRSQGRDEANYTMYYNRVNALQAQGYSERQAKKVADTESPFSSKRNRRFEYNEKVGEIETTHRKNAKEINKANKELTDYYYKLINGPGYDPGTPKREALDRKYAQKRGELEKLEKDNNDMLDREKKKAKKILEHSFSIQNGVLFINAGEPYLEHHGVKGMKWGKHLMAGKGEAGAGGGGGEDDEKLKEMAKKAGMSVAEFRTKMAGKLSGAAAKAKKEIGYAYGSEYKKDFERAARLHENNSKSMHAQAKAAWEGYGESRTAAQRDNWKRYAEYDRQAKASGNMFVKRERSKRAYDNSLASKVDSAKRKARLTQDKAKSKISDAVDAAKKTRDNVKSNIRSKTGIGVKKDIERNARLAEGQKRRAHELTKQVYSAKSKEDWARAYDESNKESSKAWDNEHKVKKDTKSYPKSIAGRVDSAKRKARLTKDRLKSALGKSKQRKQLSTEGPKAKKKVRIESASAMGFSTNNPYSIPVDARRWGYNATNKSRVSVGKRGSAPKTILNPKHTDTSHRRKSVGEVMNNARNEQTPGSTPIAKPTQYTHANRPRGREKYYKLGQESKGVKKRSRRVRHFDGSDELYTEDTRLVINSKWG